MENKIEIYTTLSGAEVVITFKDDNIWLSQKQMADLFDKDSDTIGLHLKNIFNESELEEKSTTEYLSVVQQEGTRKVRRKIKFYNLDAIISVGYRVNSKRGTQFRQWATARLKDYLVQGYAINEKRLAQKQQAIEILKTGLRIVSRAIEEASDTHNLAVFRQFAKGLSILDDYDHEALDTIGKTFKPTLYPTYEEYMQLINEMYADFATPLFAKPKDDSFLSSIHQIQQSFGGVELYPSIEEKAANLLYLITKNHSFVDGNKRIAAACFLYFLQQNKVLKNSKHELIISNELVAALTLYVANSRTEEGAIVKRLIISVLNRNR